MNTCTFSVAALVFSGLCIAFPVFAAADVLTVGPSGDYLQITDALAAASDGDILLVEPGGYISFVIDNLGVQLGLELEVCHHPEDVPSISLGGGRFGRSRLES